MSIKEIKEQYPGVNLGQVLCFCPRYKLLYVVNPKSACSTVKLLLSRLESGDFDFDSNNIHNAGATLFPPPSKLGWDVVDASLTDPSDYYKFTFVRNPLARIVSCYNDKIIKHARLFVPPLKEAAGYKDDPSVELSFTEFLSIIQNQAIEEMDQHWRPQSYNLMLECIDFDFIGKIENFDDDFKSVMEATGSPQISAVKKNKAVPNTKYLSVNDLTSKDLDIVESIYGDDFQLFEYAIDVAKPGAKKAA